VWRTDVAVDTRLLEGVSEGDVVALLGLAAVEGRLLRPGLGDLDDVVGLVGARPLPGDLVPVEILTAAGSKPVSASPAPTPTYGIPTTMLPS
jgi:hypothetical protein